MRLKTTQDYLNLLMAYLKGEYPLTLTASAFFQISEDAKLNYVVNYLLEAWDYLSGVQLFDKELKQILAASKNSPDEKIKERAGAISLYLTEIGLVNFAESLELKKLQNIHRKQSQNLISSKDAIEDTISLENNARFVFNGFNGEEETGKGKEKEKVTAKEKEKKGDEKTKRKETNLSNTFSILGSTFATTNPHILKREDLLNRERRNGVHDALNLATIGDDFILAVADGLGGHDTKEEENRAVAGAAHFGSKHLVELFSSYANPDELKTNLENESILIKVAEKIRNTHSPDLRPATALACCRTYQRPDGSVRIIGVGVGDCMIIAYTPETKQFTNLIYARELKVVGNQYGPVSFPERNYPAVRLSRRAGAQQIVDTVLPQGTILIGMTDGVFDIESNDGKALPTKSYYFDNKGKSLGEFSEHKWVPQETTYTETRIDCKALQKQLIEKLEKASTSQDVTLAISELAVANIEARRKAFAESFPENREKKNKLKAQYPEKVKIATILSEEIRLLEFIGQDTIKERLDELSNEIKVKNKELDSRQEKYALLLEKDEYSTKGEDIFRAINGLLEQETSLIALRAEQILLEVIQADKEGGQLDEIRVQESLSQAREELIHVQETTLKGHDLTEHRQGLLTKCLYTIISLENTIGLYRQFRNDNVSAHFQEIGAEKIAAYQNAKREQDEVREKMSQYEDKTRLKIGDDFAIGAITTLSQNKLTKEASLSWYQRNKGKVFAVSTIILDLISLPFGPPGWVIAAIGTFFAIKSYNDTGGTPLQRVPIQQEKSSAQQQGEKKVDERTPLLDEENERTSLGKQKEKVRSKTLQEGEVIGDQENVQYPPLFLPQDRGKGTLVRRAQDEKAEVKDDNQTQRIYGSARSGSSLGY